MKAATALQCSDGFQPLCVPTASPPAGIGNASHPATLYARLDAVPHGPHVVPTRSPDAT